MTFDVTITDLSLRMRAAWAEALCFALAQSHPTDAAEICTAYLETAETGGPPLGDPFGMVARDAHLWVAAAPPHEVVAYTLAGLELLPKTHLSTGLRKTVFKTIWRSFTDKERAAFLKAVSAGA